MPTVPKRSSSSFLPKRLSKANASVAPIFTAEQRIAAADEQTQLINPATQRPVYTPPPSSPSSPTAAPSSPSSSSSPPNRTHSPASIALTVTKRPASASQPKPMDSALLTREDVETGYQHDSRKADVSAKPSKPFTPFTSSSDTPAEPPGPSLWSQFVQYRHRNLILIFLACVIIATAVTVPLLYVAYRDDHRPPPFSPYTTCDIFCTGPVLAAYQLAHVFNDSKTFVDLPLLVSPSDTYRDFLALTNLSTAVLHDFLVAHFDLNTSDVSSWSIPDWTPSPPLQSSVSDPTFHHWFGQLNELWFHLGREVSSDVYAHPDRHTLLPLRYPYMVVPGGRFREFYYWDSYWIVRGLMLCNMTATARMVIDNLAAMVDAYGFVPNGSRQYYLTRSQPPFLSFMADFYHNATADDAWLAATLPLLSREYSYWMTADAHLVQARDSLNRTWLLNRYYASVQYPRPESYAEDVGTARRLKQGACADNSTDPDCDLSDDWSQAAKLLFSELTASAETGWDFSSRWFADRRNLSSAETSHIIPVDLNAVLYGVERVLSKLYNSTGQQQQGAWYAQQAAYRLDAMYAVLFDSTTGVWRDYDILERALDGEIALLSNYIPLWTHAYDERTDVSAIIDTLLSSQLVQPGGLLTSLDDIDQQWDCPNAWPPLQHMLFEGIATAAYTPHNTTTRAALANLTAALPSPLGTPPYSPLPLSSPATPYAQTLAYWLSSQWLYGNAVLFNETGGMYEKYYALKRGAAGEGGEYPVQVGFGWTNGVALILLTQYSAVLDWQSIADMQPPIDMGTGYPCTSSPPAP